MTARRRKRNKRWVYWLVVLALVAVAAGVGYKVWDEYFRNGDDSGVDAGGEKPVEKPTEKPVEKPVDEPQKPDEKPKEEETPPAKPQYDGGDPNAASDLTGVVTYAGVNDGVLMVRVNIDQYLAGGNCVLTLMQDGAALYKETAEVIDLAATSTCEGFNVPVGKINGDGKVGIRIMVESGGKSGIIEGEVNI